MILADSLPGFKSFSSSAAGSTVSASWWSQIAAFVAAFLMRRGPSMTATEAASILRQHRRHVATLTRFLSKVGHSSNILVCARSAALMLETELSCSGEFLFLLDGTKRHSQGQFLENSFSCGNTKRTPRKDRKSKRKQYASHPSRCHNFICGLLLTPGGLRLPYCTPYYTREHCQNIDQPFRTDAEIAAQMIRDLEVPATATVIVVGDTAYDAEVIREACASRFFRWVVPVNPERVLAGKKPRQRVRSLPEVMSESDFEPVRLSLDEGPHRQQRRLSASRVRPGKPPTRTYWVHRRMVDVHSVGEVVLLFSNKRPIRPGEKVEVDKILMSNAVGVSTDRLLEWYGLRWQIELLFKECKSVLGLDHYRVRKFAQVAGWVELCLVSFCYLEWYRATQLVRTDLSKEERQDWERARTHRLCELVRQHVEQDEVELICQMIQSEEGRGELITALRERVFHTTPLRKAV